MTPAPSLSLQTDVVQALRQSLWSNGFRPVAVYNAKYPMSSSPGKQPYGNEWQLGAQETPPRAVVELTLPFARNTGIWCGGLRAVDIDLEDEALAEKIEALSRQHLGQAPARTRANSAKRLLLYAAAVGEPKKRALTGSAGKIEVLGFGQQFVAYGTHPTGVNYEWRDSADPTTFNRADLSAVTEAQVEAFLDASRLVIGAAAETIQREVETSAPPSPNNTLARDRGRLLAAQALAEDAENLSAMGKDSGRNDALNGLAYRQGRFVAAGWIARSTVEQALQQACERNGIWIEDGPKACIATIRSGLDKGISAGPPSLADRGEPVAPILSIHGRPTASVLEAAPKAREDWPDPEPLPSGLLTVPAFSPAFLPQSIAPWVEDIADRMQAPPDFVAVPAVIALGSLIGRMIHPH